MLLILLAAIIWGTTNPLLKRYSSGMAAGSSSFAEDFCFLASRPKYLATQLLNLGGSVCFFAGLRHVDVAVGSTVANSLAFVLTVLMSAFVMREGPLQPVTLLGCTLVVAGTALCGLASSIHG
ncbi:transmembrane protein 234 [Trypanosoma rangeli]|uniref:Transmembrane protein 234 n=1 Tax=Trypanosoma rangeli TaxID=5698 RepID=A0A422N7S4_TRYRA|nr:transmembrane protein 234 [Trypanosoma rangeli]RNF01482.1 transmembrane protein 234 [Trypanosoma rangeli]|eukprot:RNF01482.1 transmembrane protein 234 [Trypanosoma rangeli]